MDDLGRLILRKGQLRLNSSASAHFVQSRLKAVGRHATATEVRNALKKLAKEQLVEPRPYPSGRVYLWRLTVAGEKAIQDMLVH